MAECPNHVPRAKSHKYECTSMVLSTYNLLAMQRYRQTILSNNFGKILHNVKTR